MIKYFIENINDNYEFILFGNCFICHGVKNTIIIDLQFSKYMQIPSDMAQVIGLTNKDIQKKYDLTDQIVITEFFNILVFHEFGVFTNSKNNFPKISLKWHSPSQISNCIIYYDIEKPKYSILFLIDKLIYLNCKHILLYLINCEEELNIYKLLHLFNDSSIVSIILIIDSTKLKYINKIIKYVQSNILRVEQIIFSGYSKRRTSRCYQFKGLKIRHTKMKITEFHKACGYISELDFSINIATYTESLQYNSCLNRKLTIDLEGNIKNCPAMNESYGNINGDSFIDKIENDKFTRMWKIKKDVIKTCRDCEYRYICTDCRAFTEDPNDIFSKPLKCGYNPNTGIWEEWSKNPLKNNAIAKYNLEAFN